MFGLWTVLLIFPVQPVAFFILYFAVSIGCLIFYLVTQIALLIRTKSCVGFIPFGISIFFYILGQIFIVALVVPFCRIQGGILNGWLGADFWWFVCAILSIFFLWGFTFISRENRCEMDVARHYIKGQIEEIEDSDENGLQKPKTYVF